MHRLYEYFIPVLGTFLRSKCCRKYVMMNLTDDNLKGEYLLISENNQGWCHYLSRLTEKTGYRTTLCILFVFRPLGSRDVLFVHLYSCSFSTCVMKRASYDSSGPRVTQHGSLSFLLLWPILIWTIGLRNTFDQTQTVGTIFANVKFSVNFIFSKSSIGINWAHFATFFENEDNFRLC